MDIGHINKDGAVQQIWMPQEIILLIQEPVIEIMVISRMLMIH